MSANILVSNGTCYSAAGDKLDDSFIPCGNAAFGPQTCCGAGDICLKNNACFGYHGEGYGSQLTYQAGCTDPEYKDQSCPNKQGIDQPWIALTLCDDSPAWAPCPQEGSPTTLRPGSYCSCTVAASTTIVISGSSVIPNVASLPRATGETISFFPGNAPTAPSNPPPAQTTGKNDGQSSSGSAGTGSTRVDNSSPAETGSRTSGAPGSSGTSAGQSPNQTDPADSPTGGSKGGLNTGAKIGIGIGVAVGVLILLITLIVLYRKRRHGGAGVTGKPGRSRTVHLPSPRASEADSNPVSEVEGKAARPWNMRSELQGSGPGGRSGVAKGKGENNGMGGVDGANAPAELPGEGISVPHHQLSPVAELPGSERWDIESGTGRGRV